MTTSSEKRTQKLVTKLGTDLRKMQDRHAKKLDALSERNRQEVEAFLSMLADGMADDVILEVKRQRAELVAQGKLEMSTQEEADSTEQD